MSGGRPPSDPAGQAGVVALSHIAIAVRDADALVATLTGALGGTLVGEKLLDDGGLRVVFVHMGPITFELLEPRRADHTVAKFLDTRGPGPRVVGTAAVQTRPVRAGNCTLSNPPRAAEARALPGRLGD